jgi:cytochrome c oxidase assembly factor CtaG/putative copper export protein
VSRAVPPSSQPAWWAGAALGPVLGVIAMAAAATGLVISGGAGPSLLDDPGVLTRWGLPLARVASDVSASVTVGLLVLAAAVLPPGGQQTEQGGAGRRASPLIGGAQLRMVRLAGATGSVWVVTAMVVIALTYSRIAGLPVTSPGFTGQLGQFLTELSLLRLLLISALIASVVATGAVVVLRQTAVGWLAVLALLALLPLALTGHAAGAANHEVAADSLAGHLIATTVWFGGLVALVVARGGLGRDLPVVVRRYSSLALWSFVVVGVSGTVNASLRLGGWSGLGTPYGRLVLAKAVAFGLLGVAGWQHRRRSIAALQAASGAAQAVGRSISVPFWRLVVGELVVMGAASGLGVALANSAPPVAERVGGDATLALTGYPMPVPLTAASWLSTFRLDLLWTSVAVALAGLYLAGWLRMIRRGDRWPVLRVLSFVCGCLILIWATGGAPGVYGRVLFSAHMVGHMTVTMVVPPLLVLAAPVTLAVRALPARRDGSHGAREWLLAVVHSRVLAGLSHPLVAAALFAGSLVAFYYTSLFELSLRTHTGHVLMHAHFLLAGYLFASVLIGIDPGPRRPAHPLRLVLLFATMAFHAFFGVALVTGTRLLAPGVLGALGRDWGRSPIVDQQYGGAVAWGFGEVPVLLLAVAITWAWVRSDDREARRGDRQADRDGGAELAGYNQRLARLADQPGGPGTPDR